VKVGDLVRIAPYCINKGRLAVVTRVADWDSQTVWITYVDGGEGNCSDGKGSAALIRNLELLNETR
jgi:hypothetical protein